MKLIFCIDKDNGLSFFGKRQSQDKTLCDYIISMVGDARLFMNEYSAKLFPPSDNIVVDNDFLEKAGEGDYSLVELKECSLENAEGVILCNWNRRYPSDKKFTHDLKGFEKTHTEDIVGSSHEKITITTYERK